MVYIVFQKFVRHDHVASVRFNGVIDGCKGKGPKMHNELESEIGCRSAGAAMAYPVMFIILKMGMEIDEHYPYLVNQFTRFRYEILPVEKDGITFNLSHLQV
jgi:hypothetical protein